ncbi:hypothetical protein [Spiroplasma endosymbiont of Zeiraphera isertana]|uniref:hypothetical protein n=1 Tax=Spiroplasma endosymbiont of Zeiraphera isertana TaxID=3066313 RepID=UPI00313B4016
MNYLSFAPSLIYINKFNFFNWGVKMEDNRKLFNISELRFWAKNPRFTNFKKVKILEIGREDFLLYDNKDIYLENLDNYYKNLIKKKRWFINY